VGRGEFDVKMKQRQTDWMHKASNQIKYPSGHMELLIGKYSFHFPDEILCLTIKELKIQNTGGIMKKTNQVVNESTDRIIQIIGLLVSVYLLGVVVSILK